MERVITYCRVSTDEQASQGYSLRDQKDKLEKYCSAHGYAVAAHYEEDYSAKTFDRPEFKKLLAFIKRNKGLITKLIFIRWDRFSRNITDALVVIRELASYGITCISIDQPLDLSIPE
ncbi:MAG: recombinase family protein, partial [Bacteroidetes bacterium]